VNKETVIIVGGGIAGLVAAKELADDYTVILIEASHRLGGRIHSTREENFSTGIEGGSEFIHGNLKETLFLLKQANIDYVPVSGNMYRKEKGKLIAQYELIEGWDEFLDNMKKVKKDISLNDFLQQYYAGEENADIRRHATGYAEGFDIADIKKVSVKSLYAEWSHEDDVNYRIPRGYGSLVNFLTGECEKKGCRVITGEIVKQIDWERNAVTVYTSGEKKFFGEKVIVTMPVSILQKSVSYASVNFTPPLDDYVKAFQQIGYGFVIKIILEFKKVFWQNDAGFILSDEIFPTWWTQLPDTAPLLTGWAGGSKAERLSDETDEELLQKALFSLANIFNMSVDKIKENLLASKVFNWQKNEWSLGAYSYSLPTSAIAKELLNTPVENTIFFAGEALSNCLSPGTVEAAVTQAKETVIRVLKKKSKRK
jgi:monoamine oxidase